MGSLIDELQRREAAARAEAARAEAEEMCGRIVWVPDMALSHFRW
jgi:hypothetical protein